MEPPPPTTTSSCCFLTRRPCNNQWTTACSDLGKWTKAEDPIQVDERRCSPASMDALRFASTGGSICRPACSSAGAEQRLGDAPRRSATLPTSSSATLPTCDANGAFRAGAGGTNGCRAKSSGGGREKPSRRGMEWPSPTVGSGIGEGVGVIFWRISPAGRGQGLFGGRRWTWS